MSLDLATPRFIEGSCEVTFLIAEIVGLNKVAERQDVDFTRATLIKIRAYLLQDRNKLALSFEERN